MSHAAPAHKRILLKLSGEALMGDDAFGINRATIVRMVEEIAEVTRLGVQVAVVIGGGNIFRGVAGGSVGMDRATADYMGMLGTMLNSMVLMDALERAGVYTRVMSAVEMRAVAARRSLSCRKDSAEKTTSLTAELNTKDASAMVTATA